MKKIIAVITIIIILAGLMVIPAHAASANAAVSVSASTVKPGDQFTVTVRVSSDTKLGSLEGTLSYSSNLVEFVSGSGVNGAGGLLKISRYDETGSGVSEFKTTITFKAKVAGTATFTFTSTEIGDYDFNNLANVSASSSISVQAEAPLSGNNYLKSLALSSGTLSPAFSKSVLNYTVNVPNNVTTMYLTPKVEDGTATTKVTGSANLKVGTNTRKVTVTAQNGATRVYTITIVRASNGSEETPPANSDLPSTPPANDKDVIFIDGEEMTVVETLPSDAIPQGFAATVTKLGDKEVMAVVNEAKTVTMLYLKNPADETAFYVYDSADISYQPYRPLTVLGLNYIVLDKPKDVDAPKGFAPRALELGDKQYDCWIKDDNQDFYLLYLCGPDGQLGFYLYDKAEGTVQRYTGGLSQSGSGNKDTDANAPVIEVQDSTFGKLGLIIIIPLGLALAAVTALLVVFVTRKDKAPVKTAPVKKESTLDFGDDFILKDDN